MVIVIATGDRESDLLTWHEKRKTIQEPIALYDCSIESELRAFLDTLESISLFSQEKNVLVAHFLDITKPLKQKILSYDGTIILISAKGELPAPSVARISDASIKSELNKLLLDYKIVLDRSSQAKLLAHLSSDDEKGKARLSPLLFNTFKRQVIALTQSEQLEANQLVKEIIDLTKEPVNQWDLLKRLFTYDKKSQLHYFQSLLQQMSVFEILAYAKTTLFLVLCILDGKKNNIDTVSIATKIKKNPFYISNIARTISEEGITSDSAFRLLTRFMNLELSLKSGKFEDEQFGFEVLLATN